MLLTKCTASSWKRWWWRLPLHQAWWRVTMIRDSEYFNELVFPSSTNSSPLIIPNSEEPMGIRDQPYPGFQKKTFCYQTHYFSKIHSWVFLMERKLYSWWSPSECTWKLLSFTYYWKSLPLLAQTHPWTEWIKMKGKRTRLWVPTMYLEMC